MAGHYPLPVHFNALMIAKRIPQSHKIRSADPKISRFSSQPPIKKSPLHDGLPSQATPGHIGQGIFLIQVKNRRGGVPSGAAAVHRT